MQLACPKCKQVLKLGAVSAETVAITCPSCGHAFQARIPQQPSTPPPTAPAANPFDALPPVSASRPASAPAGTFRQPSLPPKKRTKQKAVRGANTRSSSLVPVLAGLASLVAVAGLGFIAWTQRDLIVGGGADDAKEGEAAADPGASASLLDSIASTVFGSDTPETISDDFFAIQEAALQFQLGMKRYDEAELEELLDNYLDSSQDSRELLQRGLAIEPCSLEQHEAFTQRYEALVEKGSKQNKLRYDALSEETKERMKRGLLDRKTTKQHPYALMLIRFMQAGFCEIEPLEGEQSKIYARELELMRRLNRFLANVDDDGESSGDPARLEAFGDELVELAAERSSAEGGGMFVERGLGDAGDVHRMLTQLYWRQIETLHEPSKEFQDAMAIYKASQDLFDGAKGFSADKLRTQYTELKRGIKEPVKVAAKPAPAKPQPSKPESSGSKTTASKPAEVKPRPASRQEDTTDKLASSGGGSAAEDPSVQERSTERQASTGDGGGGADPASGSSRPGFGGMPRGPGFMGPGGMRSPSGRFGGPGGFRGPAGPRGPTGPRGESYDPRFGPNSSPPVERFKGPGGATILFKKTDDLAGTAKKWAAVLDVNEYLVRSSFDQGELMIRWSGSMEALSKKIDFGTVDAIDEAKREVRITIK